MDGEENEVAEVAFAREDGHFVLLPAGLNKFFLSRFGRCVKVEIVSDS